MDVKPAVVAQNATSIEDDIIGDSLERYALAELRSECPEVFPPLNPTQKSMLLAKQLEILYHRVVPASHERMGIILAQIARDELWRFHPAGYESLEDFLNGIGVTPSIASHVIAWEETVFDFIEEVGYNPTEILHVNMTNLKLITPHLRSLATGEESKSKRVREEVSGLLKRFDGDRKEAGKYLLEQAMTHPNRALRQNISVGDEVDTILVQYKALPTGESHRRDRWDVWIDNISTFERNLVFRRLSDVADFIEIRDD